MTPPYRWRIFKLQTPICRADDLHSFSFKTPPGIPAALNVYLPAMVRPSTLTVGEPKEPMPGVSRSFARAVMFFSRS